MQVLWWLVPPLTATLLAMVWAAWAGRDRDELRRDDSDEALQRMAKALAKPAPVRYRATPAASMEPSHGVAVRRSSASPAAAAATRR